MKIDAPSDPEETDDYLVCATWYHSIPDDCEVGACSKCGTAVIYARDMPVKPKRICMACATEMMEQEIQTGHCDG